MKLLYLTLLLVASGAAFGQKHAVITGKVYDEQQMAIELVNIKLIETNQYIFTSKTGSFSIKTTGTSGQQVTLEFTCIGFQKLVRKVEVNAGQTDLGIITLKTLDLSLKEISINAKRDYEGSTNSSLIISRDMIEQTPALSINDLLNQIPNRKVSPPSLQNVQNLTLRATFPGLDNRRNPFDMNNAFGVAIIMDGQAISNNANMQSLNPGRTGVSDADLRSRNSYGLAGTGTKSYSGDYAFGGTDLRQIPVENIESIEVIAGVPSAKWGDLTDGAVLIETRAGKSPAYVRMQLRDNATSYSYTQGFKLGNRTGAINLSMNYVDSYADNRDKLKGYRRINSGLKWSNTFGREQQISNTFDLSYGKNLDGIKADPDDPQGTKVRFDSWNFNIGNRTNYRLKGDFLKNIGLNIKYSEGHQFSYTEQRVNEAYIKYSDAVTTGITEGRYATGIYDAISQIDGRPVTLSARLDLNAEFNTGALTHYLSFGTNYSYSINKGLGQLSDPSRPRSTVRATTLSQRQSERYYDFSRIIAQQDAGLYVEDLFRLKVFNRDLNVRSGLRADLLNGFASFSPRTNVNYKLNDHITMGLAYGLAFKSPGLAQRYPGPTFVEVPLLNSYNGNEKESIYLLYVQRYDPTNKYLKSSRNQTLEFTTQIKIQQFNLSLSAFNKVARNGISTVSNLEFMYLPVYSATYRPGEQPLVTQTGERKYKFQHYTFANILESNSSGLEFILNTPSIKAIATSFNISAGIFKTAYRTNANYYQDAAEVSSTDLNYAVTGVYSPKNYASYLSNGRITATTHIPKISLIATFTAEFSLMRKSVYAANAGIPIAYYTNDNSYVTIQNFNKDDPMYGHLYIPRSELNQDNLPKIIPNYHLGIGKEIKKRFRFSFNVYNVFNYQPYYSTNPGSITYPNPPPTFGAELSLKL